MDPSDAITSSEWVKTYGPLGLLAIIGLVAAVFLWRALQSQRKKFDATLIELAKEHNETITELTKEHKAEMTAMVDRHIQTTTTQIEQYHNLAEKLHTLVESTLRRLDRREG